MLVFLNSFERGCFSSLSGREFPLNRTRFRCRQPNRVMYPPELPIYHVWCHWGIGISFQSRPFCQYNGRRCWLLKIHQTNGVLSIFIMSLSGGGGEPRCSAEVLPSVHHTSELVRLEARLRVTPATRALQLRSKGLRA